MRLDRAAAEYQDRVRVIVRPFPLEIFGGGPPQRPVLEAEWWLAALQEPGAAFAPYINASWPATTMPAFEAVWCAKQQDEAAGHKLDRRIRRAFFAESTDIGQRGLYYDLAREIGLEMPEFSRLFESQQAREAVIAEGRVGKEQFHVRGTPTLMMSNGNRLRHALAFPKMEDERIVSVAPLPCHGESCYQATRALFDQAIAEG